MLYFRGYLGLIGMKKAEDRDSVTKIRLLDKSASEKSALVAFFEKSAEDTITDKQVDRVLAPVLAMIHAGVFDRFKYRRIAGRRFSPVTFIWGNQQRRSDERSRSTHSVRARLL